MDQILPQLPFLRFQKIENEILQFVQEFHEFLKFPNLSQKVLFKQLYPKMLDRDNQESKRSMGIYDGTRKSAFFLDGIRKDLYILADFGERNTVGHAKLLF